MLSRMQPTRPPLPTFAMSRAAESMTRLCGHWRRRSFRHWTGRIKRTDFLLIGRCWPSDATLRKPMVAWRRCLRGAVSHMAGTSCQRNHPGKSERRGSTSPTRAGMRPVNQLFLPRIQGYCGNPPTSVAVVSAYRKRHTTLAQSAILAAGGRPGLWLF